MLDNIAIATGTTACFIRLGNLMNSEIIGKITDVPWAFVFEKVDAVPRHPGQLYEALAYTKEIQEAFEASLPIDMGQILSIPFIILGVYCMQRARK